MEYINISGLRLDGRRPPEVRRLRTEFGLFPKADGSALLEMGHTKVLAVVHGPREAKFRSATEHDTAVLECDFTVAPFATPERRKRRAGAADRRVTEIETALKQCFEAALELKHYPRSVISVHVMVIQSDGGLLAAAINAGILALLDAGISMRDYVVACSTLHVQKTIVLGES
jgi:exosome complex component RRP41